MELGSLVSNPGAHNNLHLLGALLLALRESLELDGDILCRLLSVRCHMLGSIAVPMSAALRDTRDEDAELFVLKVPNDGGGDGKE